jgi:ketosteroid isomerase-like protein
MADNVATVQEIYAAFGRGDVDGILAHLDREVDWEHDWGAETLPLYVPRRGSEAVRGFFVELSRIRITRFEPVNMLTGGDQVVAVIRLEAVEPVSGRQVVDLQMHLWTFGADGRATAFRHVCDTWQHARVLGLA